MFDIIWISTSFVCGLLAFLGRLPPMIGYLSAGFVLHQFGIKSFTGLDELSEMGISLLLFSIGLKLDLKSLGKPEVLGVALGQTIISFVLLFTFKFFLIGDGNIISSSILAFGLTFSSTIFVVKVLEQRGDFGAKYGIIAIGVLIIQDILAVLFMAFGTQKIPSAWLLLLIVGLVPIRIILSTILNKLRHPELLILFGLTVSFGGAYLFDLVNVKGDIGALILGVILSKHQRSAELNRWLISFKDFFLLGFYLSIGMIGLPTPHQLLIAFAISLFLPFRFIIYFFLFNRSRLRNRNSLMASAGLTNFSEFGLIVCSFAAANKMVDISWLTTFAVVLSLSFIISAILNSYSEKLYLKFSKKIKPLERDKLRDYEGSIDLGKVNVLVIGMGRVGQGAYEYLDPEKGYTPIGIDFDKAVVKELEDLKMNVISGNATSPDFWTRINFKKSNVKLILLAMPMVRQNCIAAKYIRQQGYKGKISSTSKYPNEEPPLVESGIDTVFNLYAEAGIGFAKSSCS